jgi:hypothetical protein
MISQSNDQAAIASSTVWPNDQFPAPGSSLSLRLSAIPVEFLDRTMSQSMVGWITFLHRFGQHLFGQQFLVQVARQQRDEDLRQRRQSSLLWCLLQFVVNQLEQFVRILCLLLGIVNEIGFTNECLIFSSLLIVYIGLYGYEYWTAGSKAYQLFQARGWSVILNDQLVSRSLGMIQFFIGLISGGVSVVLGLVVLGLSVSSLAPFFIWWLLGMVLSSILLQFATSTVQTVVACFAEAPNKLQHNHPPGWFKLGEVPTPTSVGFRRTWWKYKNRPNRATSFMDIYHLFINR